MREGINDMSDRYETFLHRLHQYRQRLNMTQNTASSVLGITQSQFSKMELGKTIIPYKTLSLLMSMGWDVDYLFTGKQTIRKRSELSSFLEQTEEEKKQEMLAVITWTLRQGMKRCIVQTDAETRCEIEILTRKVSGIGTESVLYEIRKITDMAQIPMSEKLGVNIKKYRMLEKRMLEPDAELLLRIYEATGCRPSLFLFSGKLEEVIINDLWHRIEQPVRGELLEFVKHAATLLDYKAEK